MKKSVCMMLCVVLMLSIATPAMAWTDFSQNGTRQTGTLTITKYLMDRVPRKGILPDGQKITDGSLDDYEPLEGIEFTIVQVMPASDQVAAASDDSAMFCNDDGLYYVTMGFPSISRVTDENGVAFFDHAGLQGADQSEGLPFGVYYVVEQPSAKVADPVKPFFVSIPTIIDDHESGDDIVLYDVFAYPKNEDIGITKKIRGGDFPNEIGLPNLAAGLLTDAHPSHLWQGWSMGMGMGTGVGYNDTIWYEITADVPTDIAAANAFVITDIFSEGLRFLNPDPHNTRFSVVGSYSWYEDGELQVRQEIIPSSAYIVSQRDLAGKRSTDPDFSDDGGTFSISFRQSAFESLGGYEKIIVTCSFQVTENASLISPIPNKAELYYVNRYETEVIRESNQPKVYTGGIRIFKHDAVTGLGLKGATFALVPKFTDDFDRDTAWRISNYGNPYYYRTVEDIYDISYENTLYVTSDENGMIELKGIPYGSIVDGIYYPTPTDYWLVEIESPDGYRLPAKPSVITISQTSWTDTTLDPVRVANVKGFNFPLTGGTGTVMFAVAACALAAAAYGLNRASRKKDVGGKA